MDPSDPLHAFAGLPLLPRTIRVQSEASMPSEPNNLESVHQFMKSMVLFSIYMLYSSFADTVICLFLVLEGFLYELMLAC